MIAIEKIRGIAGIKRERFKTVKLRKHRRRPNVGSTSGIDRDFRTHVAVGFLCGKGIRGLRVWMIGRIGSTLLAFAK
jgi:hypothetical protein